MAAYPQQSGAGTGTVEPGSAQHAHSPKQKEALRSAASLTLIAIVVVLVVGLAALVVIGRHRRRVFGGKRKRRQSRRADAWSEAGKRVEPPPPEDGSRDDTVDIDPDELGPGDVGGGGFDPHGEPPGPRRGGRR